MGIPVAHVGGIPIEETLVSLGPALLLVAGAASARVGALFPPPLATATRRSVMATYAVIAEHPPELCPTSNARTRQMMKEDAGQIPQLAEQLGVEIVSLRVFGPDHIVLAVVEADNIEPVRDFLFQSRLIQWNTTNIYATYSLEEALARADELEPIF